MGTSSPDQKALMPSWSRGRAIAEIAGMFATITIAMNIFNLAGDYLWPSLDNRGPASVARLSMIGFGLLIGSVWWALRTDRLPLAVWLTALNGVVLAGGIIFIAVRNMMDKTSLGGVEGAAIYGFGSIVVALWWLSNREIRAEIGRRNG